MTQTAPKVPSKKTSDVPTIDPNAPLGAEKEMEETELSEKVDTRLLVVGIILASVIILATIGVFVLRMLQPAKEEENTPVITVETSKEVAPTLDKSSWTVEILNGSGTAGVAALAAEKIRNLGYSVVKVGNADNQNYKTTQIYITKSLLGEGNLFLSDISSQIPGASISGELTDSTSSARIILGKQ